MITSIVHIEDIAIPVLGLCIIFALAVAAYVEPKKDFSRSIYIIMLIFCAGILITEGCQWLFSDWQDSGQAAGTMKTVMFLFYLMLAGICYGWTIYAYYWFNGRRPSKKINAVFAAGPICEAAALVINLFAENIFYVSPAGVYERGIHFAAYIGFSYAYLLIAIVGTAAAAARKNAGQSEGKQKRDFYMFLLCFLFPVIGPLIQYVIPGLPLMGVTEAVALLIVYVSIQQRTTAQYAADMARYQMEYSRYEESLEQLLSDTSNALCVFRINLTQNFLSGTQNIPERIKAVWPGDSVDSLRGAFADEITDPAEKERFLSFFDRDSLLQQFNGGSSQMSIEYHRRVGSGELHLIRAYLNMLRNPGSGDIEAITYSEDIDRRDKEEKVISAISNREYDYISLINAETGRISYKYSSPRKKSESLLEETDYNGLLSQNIGRVKDMREPGTEAEKMSFRTVLASLAVQKEYSCVFDYDSEEGGTRQKKITYQYLDKTKNSILVLVSDITEETRKEVEHSAALQKALREAKHADAMKTDFLSNLSHDMRTPLNAVLGYANLARDSQDPGEAQDYLDKIRRAGNIMLELVNDTLDLSKIESGEIILKPAAVRFGEVVGKVASAVIPLARKKHIDLAIDDELASKEPVKADQLRLQEILMNLLSNAVKFTPENGRVAFRAECVSRKGGFERNVITVSDTGCGMNPEFLPKIYEPFSQERQNEDTPGSGLGLSIVKKLVDMMGGSIEVKSRAGSGTSFVVTLDLELADELPRSEEAAELSWAALAGRRVLLVEDNKMNMEIARHLLEAKNMSVDSAENGEIACRAFAESEPGHYDALLMDIRMPVMNGHEAARTIRKMERSDADVPIIAMSADAFDDDIQDSLDAGMDAHIAKPVNAEQLYKNLLDHIR